MKAVAEAVLHQAWGGERRRALLRTTGGMAGAARLAADERPTSAAAGPAEARPGAAALIAWDRAAKQRMASACIVARAACAKQQDSKAPDRLAPDLAPVTPRALAALQGRAA